MYYVRMIAARTTESYGAHQRDVKKRHLDAPPAERYGLDKNLRRKIVSNTIRGVRL